MVASETVNDMGCTGGIHEALIENAVSQCCEIAVAFAQSRKVYRVLTDFDYGHMVLDLGRAYIVSSS